jgi:hypothetical protein
MRRRIHACHMRRRMCACGSTDEAWRAEEKEKWFCCRFSRSTDIFFLSVFNQ